MALRLARLALISLVLMVAACDDPITAELDTSLPQRWQSVSAGEEHTCAIAEDGSAWCWGRSTTARLGFLSQVFPCNRRSCVEPVPVVGHLEFESISAGNMHTCGISHDTAYCWGWDWWGQLGDVLHTDQTCSEERNSDELPCSIDPLPVALGFEIEDVSAGRDYSCAVTRSGDAYCWGNGMQGQLGVGLVKDSLLSPALVAGGHEFRAVSAGASHACALDTDAEIWCWGANIDGRLGNGTLVDSYLPVQVEDDLARGTALSWQQVDVGFIHTCGLTTGGEVYCWGAGGGRIGHDMPWIANAPARAIFPDSTTRFTQVSAGGTQSCAVSEDADLYCWGENPFGQVGNGTLDTQLAPRQVADDIEWASVDAGMNHTCGIDTSGRLYCWGQNPWGQLGSSDRSDRSTPVPVVTVTRRGDV